MNNKPKKTMIDSSKKRGPKEKLSDQEMKELAMKIKTKFKHQQLTYSLLERETGIGRNTWMRRIKEYINDLNTPISRSIGLSEGDEVYFPNIEFLFEIYGQNKQKLINELHHFELMFQDLYKERHSLLEQLKKLEGATEKIEEYKRELSKLKQQVIHYKTMYEKVAVSSVEPHLREEYGLTNNVIEFSNRNQECLDLKNLKDHFPALNQIDYKQENRNNNMSKLQNQFPDLF
ncbi:hypothetical protein ACPV3A_24460 [Paenibacillus sp. Dod16]|uniref:hypothetical protein n=1 Tax=Paenibacillus sp. Dod16 TaxID=3416392 RepID=UPI003CEA10A3